MEIIEEEVKEFCLSPRFWRYKKMFWVAIEDTGTYEVSEFEPMAEDEVLDLMTGYKVSLSSPTKIRERDREGGRNVVYVGASYKGAFGCNLWVASKFVEV